MAAALKRLWEMAQWRWTPFFGLVGGSLLYVLLAVLIIPNKIGAEKTKPELKVIGDESSSAGSETMGGGNPARTPGGRPFGRTPGAVPQPTFGPQPMERPDSPPMIPQPVPVDPRMAAPPPEAPPPPPPPAPPPPQEEDDDEEEQGASPMRPPNRQLAGALRMLPPPAVHQPPAGPEPEPEPDEPDDEE